MFSSFMSSSWKKELRVPLQSFRDAFTEAQLHVYSVGESYSLGVFKYTCECFIFFFSGRFVHLIGILYLGSMH